MTNLVARLRAINQAWIAVHMDDAKAPALNETINATAEAADEIERLRNIRCKHAALLTKPCPHCEELSAEGGERIVYLAPDGILLDRSAAEPGTWSDGGKTWEPNAVEPGAQLMKYVPTGKFASEDQLKQVTYAFHMDYSTPVMAVLPGGKVAQAQEHFQDMAKRFAKEAGLPDGDYAIEPNTREFHRIEA